MRLVIILLIIFGLGAVPVALSARGSAVRRGLAGRVSGVEIIQAAELPKTLLPVERYNGSPLERSSSEMLKLLKVTIYPEDEVRAFPNPALGIGATITVYRATPVTIDDAGTKTAYRTWKTTIKDLIAEKTIELGDKDKLEPDLETELKPDITITIIRVTVVDVTKKEPIAFKTITKNDSELDRCDTKISRKGQNGEKLLTYQITRENGKEVGRKLIKTEKTKDPVDEILAKGTKEVKYGQGKATWFGAPTKTAAHNSLARGSFVDVIDVASGKSVKVKIIGPGIQSNAVIDLSPDAFKDLAPLSKGVLQVKLVKACG